MADNASRITSKYASKRNSGRQMYGPGCCAHRITAAQITAHRQRLAIERRGSPQIKWETATNESTV